MRDDAGRGDMRDDSAEILFQYFLQEALVSSSGMGRYVHSLMLSIQHFLYRPRRRLPSLSVTYKETDLAPHPVVGLVFLVGDVERFLMHLFKKPRSSFFRVSKQGPSFTAIEEDAEVTRVLYTLNMLAKLMVLHRQILFSLAGHCCHCLGNPEADFC